MKKPEVAIIMGSDSDLPIMKEAAKTIEQFDIPYEMTIVSAHRTPERMFDFAKSAQGRGIKVIIAAAGGAAHLPGMTAANSALPVIGVPIKTKTLNGVDSFMSIAQMPPGVPVATVAINGAQNAALLALEIIALSNQELSKKIKDFKEEMKRTVTKKAQNLEEYGFEKYLEKT